ncbi:MAG: DsbC family protein [Desulfocapsaceae bacterium]|nr:DsbC family protein [Desulfocapsaceae bacterium]
MKRLLISFCLLCSATTAFGFQKDGCGTGNCVDCHALTREEASGILKGKVDDVLSVKLSDVPGLWQLEASYQGKTIPLYLDFSKKYVISGNIIRLQDGENITPQPAVETVDVKTVPLQDAVVIGDPKAPIKIIVFDDPQCPFCQKLHPEMEQVVLKRKDIAFYIKMFPLPSHPNSYERAKTIICTKSAKILADSLAGKPVPPAVCETDQVDKNIQLAEKLHINSTPTLILPDGRVYPGYKPADAIISLLENTPPPAEK